ncbi:hypothetical protein [Oryzifoliimicrobium ureilyticus]|uniref:hypothetical protein n=1 Tax=Oryzifoliimicrobium ureilyticus TaxID=3113724 RepID=UPI0030767680
MRSKILFTAMILMAATAAKADDRFVCSGDDTDVRFTVDVAFGSQQGMHLTHFRGAVAVKRKGVSAAFGKRIFGSDQLLQSWWRGKTLRLEVLDEGGRETDQQKLNLVIGATREDAKDQSFTGKYELTVSGQQEPYKFEGKVYCGQKG